jgi:hypothetical protein
MRHMPRRTGPQERASGFDALRDRLPRAIAARLTRAGLLATGPGPRARQPETPPAAGDDERRDDPPRTIPGTLAR